MVIMGVIIWAWFAPLDNVYVTTLGGNSPYFELRFLNNTPLIQTFFLFFGILTLILVRLQKGLAFPIALVSLGLFLAFGTGFILGAYTGGFPLEWFAFPLTSCSSCAGGYYIGVYPFLIDWIIWNSLILGSIYAIREYVLWLQDAI